MTDLLLGCGTSRERRIKWGGRAEWSGLVTLDIDPQLADVVHDLTKPPLPFDDNSFDEIHAYEVLEHVGQQGDWKLFFAQFADFWRVLKPGGVLCGTCPAHNSVWAWGDPGHTRVVSRESFVFLHQPSYAQVGQTPMTDYRPVYRADFEPQLLNTTVEQFQYVLEAIKPSRCKLG